MSAFMAGLIGSFIGTGVPMVAFFALVKAGINKTPKAPALRPCSCGHGLGRHEKTEQGFGKCGHVSIEIREVQGPVIRRTGGNPLILNGKTQHEIERKEYKLTCGCKVFDGEIPPDMIGRDWMGIG